MAMHTFNSIYEIPSNRRVIISNANQDILNGYPLFIDDDYSFKFNSKFGTLWESQSNNLLNLLSSTLSMPNGQFAEQGMQIWQSTDPMGLDLSVKLEMDTDAKNDVMRNALVLMQTCLPTKQDMNTTNGLMASLPLKLTTLIPPGPNLLKITDSIFKDKEKGSKFKESFATTASRGTYTVTIGKFKLNDMIITSVEPTFSSMVDEEGYPTSCKLSMSMSTFEVATTDMLKNMVSELSYGME